MLQLAAVTPKLFRVYGLLATTLLVIVIFVTMIKLMMNEMTKIKTKTMAIRMKEMVRRKTKTITILSLMSVMMTVMMRMRIMTSIIIR